MRHNYSRWVGENKDAYGMPVITIRIGVSLVSPPLDDFFCKLFFAYRTVLISLVNLHRKWISVYMVATGGEKGNTSAVVIDVVVETN
jgi:hypothetical protein